MLVASLSPMALAVPVSDEAVSEFMAGDLDEFDATLEGNQYMFTDDKEPVFSATSYLKKQWVEAGYPNLILPFSQSYSNSRSTARNCTNAWSQGDTDTIPTASGTVDATVQKISTNSAIFVQNGQVIPATTLNDIA